MDHRSSTRLIVDRAVAVVDRVTECRSAVFGHFGVAAQYMLLVLCACVGPRGPGCKLPGRWLLLICEEGLVPPINTNSSDKRFRQVGGNKREQGEGVRKLAAYLPVPRQVDLESFGVILETKRSHGEEYVLAIHRFALLLLTLFGSLG